MRAKDEQSNNKRKDRSFFKSCKREFAKSTFFFTAGALTSAILLINNRRKKKLKNKYKQQLAEMKANDKEDD